jgi:DNA-binding winged helix-turn-helix (wHTH) protein
VPQPTFRFDRFELDPGDRQLRRDDAPVELNARYLDALTLLVREAGKLVSKDRFLAEVWRGVPVTDEALTQCVKSLRRQLGDNATQPRFIETVPRHGYRFIAPVECVDPEAGARSGATAPAAPVATSAPAAPAVPVAPVAPVAPLASPFSWRHFLVLGSAGMIGGGVSGIFGGLVYGFASQPLEPAMGAASALLVLVALTIVVGLIGGAGVSFGIAAAGFASGRPWAWSMVGGALGGLVVGAFAKLLGVDMFNLLFGQSPGDITGAAEGALLGGAIGFAALLGNRGKDSLSLRRSVAAAALAGGAAGVLIPMLGGRLMGGSLDLLANHFPNSRLRLDQIGSLFGERGFGPISQAATGGLEGALFGACIVGAMLLARRSLIGND